jgi:hypothetical protein
MPAQGDARHGKWETSQKKVLRKAWESRCHDRMQGACACAPNSSSRCWKQRVSAGFCAIAMSSYIVITTNMATRTNARATNCVWRPWALAPRMAHPQPAHQRGQHHPFEIEDQTISDYLCVPLSFWRTNTLSALCACLAAVVRSFKCTVKQHRRMHSALRSLLMRVK